MNATRQSTIALQGMDCADCAAKLEKSVRKLEGVVNADVNLISSTLTVDHTGETKPIKAIVRRQGYLRETEDNRFFTRGPTLATIGSALLLALALILPQYTRHLLLAAVVAGGIYPARAGIINLVGNRSFDINFLMTVAVTGAVFIGELGEAATVVLLFALSHNLETYTMGRTRRSIRNLMELAPDYAWLLTDGKEVKTATSALKPDDQIVVRPGERVPIDGEIIDGTSELNLAPVTGESIPVLSTPGQPVYAGIINGSGQLIIRVTRPAADSTLARIVNMVEQASTSKAPVQRFVDRFARIYTPIVMAIAALTILVPPLALGQGWETWLYRGLTLLVVACPCALVISTPVSIVSALGNAAGQGILIKDGSALELAAQTRFIALDKTGTLTSGEPKLAWVEPVSGYTREQVLAIAAAIEAGSTHPLAQAVLNAATHLKVPAAGEHRTLPGRGASARVDNSCVYAVNPTWLAEQNIEHQQPHWKGSLVAIVRDDKLLGWLGFSDTPRPQAAATIQHLHELGIEAIMLTGDNPDAAAEVAAATGIDDYFARLLPEDKLAKINALRSQGGVMMVGDGINDAPALAAADIGVAMGGIGSDTALETAHMALMGDNISKLPFTIGLSRKALKIIRWNIYFAIGIKLLALALIVPGWLTLWMAILADTGAALLVILNSMRLLRWGRQQL
ncbi:MAG: cadmium-translocating P-type ATPase [Firmicutes bacterium]|nr:cadmium-translocating P-type ATPase [Bacillota bacterium]